MTTSFLPENFQVKEFFANDGLFARTMNRLWDLICVSILWFVCSVPLITLGAASTAAYYTCAKVLRHHNGHIFGEFFRCFRREFRQSTLLTLILAALLAVLVLDCVYFYGSGFLFSLFCMMMLMLAGCTLYMFALLSRFSMGLFRIFRTGLVLMFRHLFKTILLLILLFSAALGIYLMPWGILVFPGLAIWLSTWLLEPVLRSCAPDPEGEESEKWYYQLKINH